MKVDDEEFEASSTSSKGEKKRFEVVKWEVAALSTWSILGDRCAICRNHIMVLCIECEANQVPSADKKCTLSRSVCKHAFHFHCISRWLKTRRVCPLDNKEWVFEYPLETIFKKPLHCAPLRLQRILWDVLQYSPKVKYMKGTKLPIADTLSRDCQTDEVEDDVEYAVHAVVAMTTGAKERFVKSTESDNELKELKEIVMTRG